MSSISDEKAIITLEVELVSNVKGLEGADAGVPDSFFEGVGGENFEDTIKKAVDDSIKESIEGVLDDEGVDVETLQNLTNAVKDLDSKAMGNITSFAKNPEAFTQRTFLSILGKAGPYGAIAAAIISTLVAGPELVKAVVEMFGVKGGLLNQDYRYTQEEFLSQEFDRRVQFKRLTGDDPVITVTTIGFVTPSDPDFEGNSLVDANIARTARIGLRESGYGYIHGI